MKKQKLILGAGVAAGCAAAIGGVSHVVTRKLVGIALDRELPFRHGAGQQRRLSGSGTVANAQQAAVEAAERLVHTPHERVEIRSRDGLTLVGHWFPCEGAERTILAMHGWRSGWARDFGVISEFWHGSRCNVLYAEQRAQGDSEGAYMGFGLLERFDCADWAAWIRARTGAALPICLAGVSMGATTVLLATALPLPETVSGVIADCGFDSAHGIWKHVTERNLHLSYNGWRKAVVDGLCRKRLQQSPDDCSTREALQRNADIPVLFIHGTADRFVPVEMTYANYEACAAPKQLFVVPGAGHGMSYFTDRAGYEDAMRRFWAWTESGASTRSSE